MTRALMAVVLLPATALAFDLSLTWTAPGDDGNVGTASGYDIRYSTDSTDIALWTPATQATGEPSPDTAGSSEGYILPDLHEDSTYFIALQAWDDANNYSQTSNIVRFQYVDSIPPAAVFDLKVGP